jgi:hypothetical protein
MANLSAKHWFISIKGRRHLTVIDEDGPHGPYSKTLCGKSSLERNGKTPTKDDTADGTECQKCLKGAGYSIPDTKNG